jgi:hypothetical protein
MGDTLDKTMSKFARDIRDSTVRACMSLVRASTDLRSDQKKSLCESLSVLLSQDDPDHDRSA